MSKRSLYYEDCRGLFLRGRTLEEISAATGVSVTTLSKWKQEGNWEQQRKELNKHPMRMAEKLDGAMEKMVDELVAYIGRGERPPDTLADGIAKLGAVRRSLATEEDLPRQIIYVTDMLAQYAHRKLQDDEAMMGKITELLSGFYQEVAGKNG